MGSYSMQRPNVRLLAICAAATATFLTVLAAGPPEAGAVTFDERGKASLDAEFTEGFEDDLSSDEAAGGTPAYSEKAPLEGDRTLLIGDGTERVLLLPTEADFEGRRVNVRLWYRAQGTDLAPRLLWLNRTGSPDGSGYAIPLANAPLHRTGRATTDGWVELETGPIDWEFGPAGGPTALVLTDTQFSRRRPLGRDSSLAVQVDAVEIEDLGERAVPAEDCRLGSEDETCGGRGVCMLGKCVDSAAALGTLPRPSVREDYLKRRLFLVESTLAVRRARTDLEEFQTQLEVLRATNAKGTWSEMIDAWELLRDGHARPPSSQALQVRSLAGDCLGPGDADLLEDVPDAPVPMVFDAETAKLKQGDVLTAIDGMPVEDWRAEASRYLYYNGDPAGRDALQVNETLKAAILAGSTVEFTRCERPKSQLEQPCSASEATTVTIDYSEEVGDPIWNDTGAQEYFGRRRVCDFRFDTLRPAGSGVRRGEAYFDKTSDGIVRGEFYDMPRPQRGGNGDFSPWRSDWEDAMSGRPASVLVDQRLGFGGSFVATHYLGSLFLDGAKTVREVGLPWFGVELTDEWVDQLRQCAAQTRSRRGCSGIFSNNIQERLPTDLGADSKLALLSARSVSGHDFYAKYMTFRDAKTRFFGYSPTVGGFGEFRQFAPLPGEVQPPNYQYHDSRFFTGEGDFSKSSFTSGRGIGPDEVVYQKQSDALLEVDTAVEAAKQWLRSSN